jgi:hypothetical protein
VGVTGATQTTITANFPTGSSYPTRPQIAAAENLTRAQFEIAMVAARATGDTNQVAVVSTTWDTLCGLQNWFDSVLNFVVGEEVDGDLLERSLLR